MFWKFALALLLPVFFAIGAHAQERSNEVRFSLGESRTVVFTPEFALARSSLAWPDGTDGASGVELGARLLSASNRTRSILVGLDLRQWLARIDAHPVNFDLLGTRLGLRLDWQPAWKCQPDFGLAWFFGDTIVSRARDEQFNGDSFALSASIASGGSGHIFIEAIAGQYREGPGFIELSRRPGDDTLSIRELRIGLEFTIALPAPDWLPQASRPEGLP